ncbi:MAG: ABC transporter ATP-binding protein [Prochlorotrichaceae cyanobacterium]
MNSTLLALENVTCRFSPQGHAAVANLSLNIQEGELLSLLGPSGCGKTTLLRLIAGFEQPQTGQISLAGSEVACPQCNLPPEHRQVGMVFQDYALFPHLTVVENIAFGLALPKASTAMGSVTRPSDQSFWQKVRSVLPQRSLRHHRERIAAMLDLVGLQGLENRYPHQLSGGQQQRVALARALAPQPRLILLDEPLSNLDIQVRLHLRQELRQILKRAGTTAILVTHDQEEALAISDRIAVMYRGQLEQVGDPQTVYQNPSTRFVAEFVTQANFLPLRTSGSGGQTEIGWVDLPPHCDQDAPLDLMVRQEDLILQAHPEGIAQVVDWEFLGREQRYHLCLPSGQCLKVRQPLSCHLAYGDRVLLDFTPQFRPVLFPPLAAPFRRAHPSPMGAFSTSMAAESPVSV